MRFPLFAFALLVLAGCNKEAAPVVDGQTGEQAGHVDGEAEHSGDITLTAEAAKIAGIEVGEARMVAIQAQLKVPGVVTNTATGRAVVTPPSDGKIVRLHVSPGSTVRPGQPIATLQSHDLAEASAGIIEAQRGVIAAEAGAKEAASSLDLSRARLRSALASLERQKEFAKAGAFSQPALHEAQRELNESEAELESATQEHELHRAQLERAERLFKQELISRTELEQARLEVQNDRIRMDKARRQIEIAKASFERERAIAQQGLSNSREIQAAEAEVRAANLEVEQSKIRLDAARSGVAGARKGLQAARASYSARSGGARASGGTVTVVAPIGGVVTHREVTVGQAVERTTEICEIENLRSVWVTASVPEKDIAVVRMGARAQVTVKAHPGRVFVGVVQVVGSRLDPKSRTMPVQVVLDNASGALRADMFATVSLGFGSSAPALAVPRSAVVEEGDLRLVYVLESSSPHPSEGATPSAGANHSEEEGSLVFEERVVTTGRVQGDLMEIVDGLEPGARVVVKGAFVLKSEKVKGELKGHGH